MTEKPQAVVTADDLEDADSLINRCQLVPEWREELSRMFATYREEWKREGAREALDRVGDIVRSHMDHDPRAGHEHGGVLGCLPTIMVEINEQPGGVLAAEPKVKP